MTITATYKCLDGGHGWGETGGITRIQMDVSNWYSAVRKAESMMPGGWCIVSLKQKDIT